MVSSFIFLGIPDLYKMPWLTSLLVFSWKPNPFQAPKAFYRPASLATIPITPGIRFLKTDLPKSFICFCNRFQVVFLFFWFFAALMCFQGGYGLFLHFLGIPDLYKMPWLTSLLVFSWKPNPFQAPKAFYRPAPLATIPESPGIRFLKKDLPKRFICFAIGLFFLFSDFLQPWCVFKGVLVSSFFLLLGIADLYKMPWLTSLLVFSWKPNPFQAPKHFIDQLPLLLSQNLQELGFSKKNLPKSFICFCNRFQVVFLFVRFFCGLDVISRGLWSLPSFFGHCWPL